jgi:hypothetical protein
MGVVMVLVMMVMVFQLVVMVMVVMVFRLVVMVMMVVVFRFMTMKIFHVVVVIFVLGIQQNSKVTGIQSRFRYSADVHLVAPNRQTCQSLQQNLLVSSQIQQGGNSHITADTSSTFQIKCFFHGLTSYFSQFNP